MALETIIKNCKSSGIRLLVGTFLALSLIMGCGNKEDGPQHVVVDDPVIIDPSHVGMITGQVLSSKIENNQVVYEGLEEARVYVQDTDFRTKTISEGIYSIDNIPAGSYNVGASWGYVAAENTKPVTVRKQETVTVPDLKLNMEPILKGKIYETGTPFAGEEVDLYGGTSSCWEKLHSTTTSSDGSYAFERSKSGSGKKRKFCLKNSEAIIMFWDTDTESIIIPHEHDIVEKDAYVSEYK